MHTHILLWLTFFGAQLIAEPFISEFLANPNSTSLADEDGDAHDWIEIANPDASALPLGGYYLTDDPTKADKWMIPAGTVVPGSGYLVIFASDKTRNNPAQNLHTDFKLSSSGDYLALLAMDGVTVVSEYTWTASPQHPNGVSFGKFGNPLADEFLANPTPGAANIGPVFNPGKVLFDKDSQTFTGNLTITMTPEIAGMEIRYTTDLSEPNAASTLYTDPISISNTTMIRARLVGTALGSVSGRHYLELSTSTIPSDLKAGTSNLSGFTSNLPVVVLDTIGGPGATTSSLLRTTSVSLFEPVDGVTSFNSPATISTRAGIRIRGQSSSGFAKKQYRIETRNQEDEDKDVSFLGLPSDSDWVFGAPYTDKALIRNSFVYDLGREIGILAPRTRHVEVFLNENGGPLNYAADYKGVYLITESNKISKDRVDLQKLLPADEAEPDITGGYLVRWEYNAVSFSNRLPGWSHLELSDPDPTTEATIEQKIWVSDYVKAADDAVHSVQYKDPVNGYAPFFDLPSYYNLFVINELTRDQDAYMRSAYFHKDRGGKLVMGPLWDYNLIMGNGCCRGNRDTMGTGNFFGTNSGWQWLENNIVNEAEWEVRLVSDPNFWQGFADRWQGLRQDALSDAAVHARMDAHAAPLAAAAVRNFAVWNNLRDNKVGGFFTPITITWEGQIDDMKDWSAERMMWLDSQFTSPPVVQPENAVVPSGTMATVYGLQGTIYYTTDGTDPRLPGGGVKEGALSYETVGLVDVSFISSESEGWQYLDDGSDPGSSDIVVGNPAYNSSNWKHPDFDDSTWETGAAPLGYSNPNVTTTIDYGSDSSLKHWSYYFRKSFNVTNADAVTGLVMEIQYDDGAVVYLNGKEIQRVNMLPGTVSYDTPASASQAGSAEIVWEVYSVSSSDLVEGNNVIAIQLHQRTQNSSDLSVDFRLMAQEPGGTPAAVEISDTTTINARALDGGDWSRLETQTLVVGNAASTNKLVISEIHYNPLDASPAEVTAGFTNKDDFEFLELLNASTEDLDLSGVHFSAGIDFDFPTDTIMTPASRLVIVRNEAAFKLRYPDVPDARIAGEFKNATGLGNDSDTISLNAVDGSIIHSMRYLDQGPWPEAANGDGMSLVLLLPYTAPDHSLAENWRASELINGSPNDSDGVPFGGGTHEQLLSYATGGVIPVVHSLVDGKIDFVVGLNLLADDIAGHIEISTDLVNWQPAETEFGNISLAVGLGNMATVTFRSKTAFGNPKTFLRYVVQE